MKYSIPFTLLFSISVFFFSCKDMGREKLSQIADQAEPESSSKNQLDSLKTELNSLKQKENERIKIEREKIEKEQEKKQLELQKINECNEAIKRMNKLLKQLECTGYNAEHNFSHKYYISNDILYCESYYDNSFHSKKLCYLENVGIIRGHIDYYSLTFFNLDGEKIFSVGSCTHKPHSIKNPTFKGMTNDQIIAHYSDFRDELKKYLKCKFHRELQYNTTKFYY